MLASPRRWLQQRAMGIFAWKVVFAPRPSTSSYELLPIAVSRRGISSHTKLRYRGFAYISCALLAVLGVSIVTSRYMKLDPGGGLRLWSSGSLTNPRGLVKHLSLFNASIDMLCEGLAQGDFTSVDLVKVSIHFRLYTSEYAPNYSWVFLTLEGLLQISLLSMSAICTPLLVRNVTLEVFRAHDMYEFLVGILLT